MQDNYSGAMEMLDSEMYARDPQAAKDAVLPRNRQGIVLEIGEEVSIKGGRFAVQSIGKNMIVLRGLPSTDINPPCNSRSF